LLRDERSKLSAHPQNDQQMGFTEPVIGRAFARPVGSTRPTNLLVVASEAKQSISVSTKAVWIASSLSLLAMTSGREASDLPDG